MKMPVDTYKQLDVRDHQHSGTLAPGKATMVRWGSGHEARAARIGSESEECVMVRFTVAGVQRVQRIALTYTSPNYGGRRPWFLCGCARRVAKLYLVGGRWGCRECCDLDYPTQHEGRYMRAYRRKKAIYRRLGSPWPENGAFDPPMGVPTRPPGMHSWTYTSLLCQLSRCQREMYEEIAPLAAKFREAMEMGGTEQTYP